MKDYIDEQRNELETLTTLVLRSDATLDQKNEIIEHITQLSYLVGRNVGLISYYKAVLKSHNIKDRE